MKKVLSWIGILTGITLIITGIVVASGGTGNGLSYGQSSPYDSGFASFGGDYYTYSVNNIAEATSAASAAASNTADVYRLVEFCLGMFMMFFGIITSCGFGIVLASFKKDAKDVCICQCAENAEEVVTEEATEVATEETVVQEEAVIEEA